MSVLWFDRNRENRSALICGTARQSATKTLTLITLILELINADKNQKPLQHSAHSCNQKAKVTNFTAEVARKGGERRENLTTRSPSQAQGNAGSGIRCYGEGHEEKAKKIFAAGQDFHG
jgi:hypothetical protein